MTKYVSGIIYRSQHHSLQIVDCITLLYYNLLRVQVPATLLLSRSLS